MAYDEDLAGRVRDELGDAVGVTEKKMFGGVGWLVAGNMAVGVMGEQLIVRVPPDETDSLLEEPGAEPFVQRDRPMRGWLLVTVDAAALAPWVGRGVAFARSLPAK